MKTITDTIRDTLYHCDETLYAVAKATGINWSTLQRFIGGGGLRSDHVDTLAEYFRLELTSKDSGEKKKAKKKSKKKPVVKKKRR